MRFDPQRESWQNHILTQVCLFPAFTIFLFYKTHKKALVKSIALELTSSTQSFTCSTLALYTQVNWLAFSASVSTPFMWVVYMRLKLYINLADAQWIITTFPFTWGLTANYWPSRNKNSVFFTRSPTFCPVTRYYATKQRLLLQKHFVTMVSIWPAMGMFMFT